MKVAEEFDVEWNGTMGHDGNSDRGFLGLLASLAA